MLLWLIELCMSELTEIWIGAALYFLAMSTKASSPVAIFPLFLFRLLILQSGKIEFSLGLVVLTSPGKKKIVFCPRGVLLPSYRKQNKQTKKPS